MWVERSPDEVARWDERTGREARRRGLGTAVAVGVIVSLSAAFGFFYTRIGVILRSVAGGFAMRLLSFAGAAVPFCWWVYGQEMRRELAKARRGTICPACDIAGDGNAGQPCQCGGVFVPLRQMKWVEDSPMARAS